MSKFTREPWIRSRYGFNVLTSDGECSICELKDTGDLGLQIANANLIAAAPEMYEALKKIFDHWSSNEQEMSISESVKVFKQAEAALAKADGEVAV